jgi:uncharacterized protein (TIGR00290 family)
LSWSGGKDSALALYHERMQAGPQVEVLLTTVTQPQDRISMHGVSGGLLRQQARNLGLDLQEITIQHQASNAAYELAFLAGVTRLKDQGIETIVFGDIFLQDVREYRERLLEHSGVTGRFPLWGQNSHQLAERFIEDGFRAVVCTVDPRQIDGSFCGREYDAAFLADLPATADPCGENGEFHTFVYAGPVFQQPLAIERGVVVERSGFLFCDLYAG